MGCDNCADLGHTDDAGEVTCPECNGTGNVTEQREADRETGRRVRELVKQRGFATLAYRPYDGRWLVVFGFDPAKPFEGDTLDEAVAKAANGTG